MSDSAVEQLETIFRWLDPNGVVVDPAPPEYKNGFRDGLQYARNMIAGRIKAIETPDA